MTIVTKHLFSMCPHPPVMQVRITLKEVMNSYIKQTFLDECHVSNITVVTDTTETDNVTSISIEHETGTFYNQEHDNKV